MSSSTRPPILSSSTRPPILIIVLAALAATAMAGGILTTNWLTVDESMDGVEVQSRMGLWGQATITQCVGGECNTMSGTLHFDDSRLDSDTKIGVLAGSIGYVAGLVAALAMLGIAVLLTVGNPIPKPLRSWAWPLCVGAAANSLVFVLMLGKQGEQTIGYSAIVFGVGAACGIGASLLVLRRP